MAPLLPENEIRKSLETLPGWALEGPAIHKRFPFPRYMDGIRFVEAIAIEAEAEDHHPDLLVRFADVTVFLSTHSQGGVTEKDLRLAVAIERIAPQFVGA